MTHFYSLIRLLLTHSFLFLSKLSHKLGLLPAWEFQYCIKSHEARSLYRYASSDVVSCVSAIVQPFTQAILVYCLLPFPWNLKFTFKMQAYIFFKKCYCGYIIMTSFTILALLLNSNQLLLSLLFTARRSSLFLTTRTRPAMTSPGQSKSHCLRT